MFSAHRRHTFILNTDHQIEGSRILNLMNYDTFTCILYAFTSLTTPTHNQKQISSATQFVAMLPILSPCMSNTSHIERIIYPFNKGLIFYAFSYL